MGWTEILVLLLVTIGPVRAAIVYLSLTKSADAELKRAIAIRTVTISAIVCVVFALLGAGILAGLKVSVEALLIAGGAILFIFALQLILGDDKEATEDGPPPAPSIEIASFPLAVPLMASPHGLVAIVAIEATLQGVTQSVIFVALILVRHGLQPRLPAGCRSDLCKNPRPKFSRSYCASLDCCSARWLCS